MKFSPTDECWRQHNNQRPNIRAEYRRRRQVPLLSRQRARYSGLGDGGRMEAQYISWVFSQKRTGVSRNFASHTGNFHRCNIFTSTFRMHIVRCKVNITIPIENSNAVPFTLDLVAIGEIVYAKSNIYCWDRVILFYFETWFVWFFSMHLKILISKVEGF